MTRLLLLGVVAILIYLILRSAFAALLVGLRGGARAAAPRPLRDQLVKDPVCETYVPRATAVARSVGAETRYFCSRACAEKFRAAS